MGEARAATASEGARRGSSTDPASAVFTIRTEYKGQERSTGIPFDEEAIGQLAMEGRDQGMQIRELVMAVISAIIKKEGPVATGAAASFRRAVADCVRERVRLAEHCDGMD